MIPRQGQTLCKELAPRLDACKADQLYLDTAWQSRCKSKAPLRNNSLPIHNSLLKTNISTAVFCSKHLLILSLSIPYRSPDVVFLIVLQDVHSSLRIWQDPPLKSLLGQCCANSHTQIEESSEHIELAEVELSYLSVAALSPQKDVSFRSNTL